MTAAMPWRSMSFIVKTWTPRRRGSRSFSRSSRLRTPMSTVCVRRAPSARSRRCATSSAGSGAEQRRERHAVDVAARATSPACSCRRARPPRAGRSALAVAPPRSPPTRRPTRRRASDRRRARAAARLPRATASDVLVEPLADARDLADVLLLSDRRSACVFGNRRGQVARVDDRERRAPASRSPRPAMRNADGPMSTPRRPPPRSSGHADDVHGACLLFERRHRAASCSGVGWRSVSVRAARSSIQRGL